VWLRRQLDGPKSGEALPFALLLGHLDFTLALLGDGRVLVDILNILQAFVGDLGAWDCRLGQDGMLEGLLLGLLD
jgi:hypothetical protein